MSSREPLWFCHECNAEMRPLMVPDPHCASCNGTFVEQMENPEDDPRTYQQQMPGGLEEGFPPGMDQFLRQHDSISLVYRPIDEEAAVGLHQILHHSTGRDSSSPTTSEPDRPPGRLGGGTSPRTTRIELGGPREGGARIITIGGPNMLGSDSAAGGAPQTLSQFLRSGPMAPEPTPRPAPERNTLAGPLMAQYLLALLTAQRAGGTALRGNVGGDPLLDIFGRFGPPGEGPQSTGSRWGDYVFNQEALDEIITQLMENSNSGRPVPATDEIIAKLPRELLLLGSAQLEKDCAVCKEQFTIDAEDTADLVVVTLPCKHPFHEGCIVPWIKASGTCPVCRYALVPQPEHHAAGPAPPGGGGAGSPPTSPRTPPPPPPPPPAPSGPAPRSSGGSGSRHGNSGGSGSGGGFFTSLFGSLGGLSSSSRNRSSSNTSQPRRRRTADDSVFHFPGGWGDS